MTFDKAVIDGKGIAHDYYGQYTVYIQGGDSRACCHTKPEEVILFTYTLVNKCNETGMIDYIDTKKLLTASETGLEILE